MNTETEIKKIIVSVNGINWTWYHWLTIEGNIAIVTRSKRFHKFDDCQGAGDHPKTDLYCNIYHGHMDPAVWGQERVDQFKQSWVDSLVAQGLPADTKSVIHVKQHNSETKVYALKNEGN